MDPVRSYQQKINIYALLHIENETKRESTNKQNERKKINRKERSSEKGKQFELTIYL